MTEPKFTPGPWTFDDTTESFGRPAVVAKGAERYSTYGPVCLTMKRHPNYKSNAALIAAAPEMYNAEKDKITHLQTLKNQIRCLLAPKKDTVVTLDFVLKYIDAIIGDTENLLAKARGEAER